MTLVDSFSEISRNIKKAKPIKAFISSFFFNVNRDVEFEDVR